MICLKNHSGLVFGLSLLFFYSMVALFGPFLLDHNPVEMSVDTLALPSRVHLLGTNDIGQDIFSRLVYSGRQSIINSLAVGVIATSMSSVLGAYAGVAGGRVDKLIMRVTDTFLALPELIVCLLISALISPTQLNLILLLSFLEWPIGVKIIRAQVIQEKNNNYVLAAETFGANKVYLFTRHILQNILPLVATIFIRSATIAVFMESGLSFLGLLDPSTISWGRMIADAMSFTYLPIWKTWLLPAGLVLSMFIVSLTFIGSYFENSDKGVV